MPVQSRHIGSILWNHYEWCLKEGRDTSWYFCENTSQEPKQKNIERTEVEHGGNGIHNR